MYLKRLYISVYVPEDMYLNRLYMPVSQYKKECILAHVLDFEFVEGVHDAYLYQMVTKPTRSRLGQTANITDLVLVNNEFFYD